MRGEVRGRLHEVLDSVLRGTGTVSLTENYGEQIKVHPECRLIAAQNEPGNDQSDRQVLDAPQLTRFVYIKQEGHTPRRLQEKAMRCRVPRTEHRSDPTNWEPV